MLASPLPELTHKGQPKPVQWSPEREHSLTALKSAMCFSPVLYSPYFQNVMVPLDASDVGTGAVLAQGEKGYWRPVLHLSHKLGPQENSYSSIENESLATKLFPGST